MSGRSTQAPLLTWMFPEMFLPLWMCLTWTIFSCVLHMWTANSGLYGTLQHSPHSLPSNAKTASSVHCNKPVRLSIAQERVYLQSCVGVWAEWKVCFEKSGGKFPCLSACHCSVSLRVHACGWKTRPAELCLSVPVEKHPPANRPAVYLLSGSHVRKRLTYGEHINSPAECRAEIHLAAVC